MEILTIEWMHLDVNGETCDRCFDTGAILNEEIRRLNKALNPKGFQLELKEIQIGPGEIAESNLIRFNGVPIEELLDIKVVESYCESCSDLTESEAYCRAVLYQGKEYEEVPAAAIREAVHRVIGLQEETPAFPVL
jgi:hypothetical protein